MELYHDAKVRSTLAGFTEWGYLLWLLVKVIVDRPIYYIATVAKMRKAIKKRASLVLR